MKYYLIGIIIFYSIACNTSKIHYISNDASEIVNSNDNNFNIPDEIILIPFETNEYSSFLNLLLNGFPGSKQSDPIIPIPKQKNFYNSIFFKDLENNYLKYRNHQFDRNGFIAINLKLLRQELEFNNLINQLGL